MSPHFPRSTITPASPYSRELVEKLLPYADLKRVVARKRLFLNSGQNHYCYLIVSGQAILHRANDDLVLTSLTSPSLVGIGNLATRSMEAYIKVLTVSDIGILTLDKVREAVREQNMWELLALHMMVITNKLYMSSQVLTAPTSYDIIKAQLIELMSEDEALRGSITAENYIRDKTNLSRSGIMKILAELKEGEYIEIRRGKLIKVNVLPEKY